MAGVAARPEHARPRDHSAAEPVARAVEGGVDAAPVVGPTFGGRIGGGSFGGYSSGGGHK